MAVPTVLKKRFGIHAKLDWILDFLAGNHQQTKNNDWIAGVPILKGIAFDASVQTLTTEYDFGWDIPANSVVLDVWVEVDTVDATETLDVGILSTEGSGDADGFLAAVSLATAGIIKGTLASGGQTLGALLRVDESGAGVLVPEPHVVVASSQSVSATASAGTDTAAGKIWILYVTMP